MPRPIGPAWHACIDHDRHQGTAIPTAPHPGTSDRSRAWNDANPGPQGFYRRKRPHQHFATEAQTGLLAEALARWIRRIAERWTEDRIVDVVDIGAGSGELLLSLHQLLNRTRLSTHRGRRAGATGRIARRDSWITGEAPKALSSTWPDGVTGVVLAHEWLDDLPIDVVARDQQDVVREILVDPRTGLETLGDPVGSDTDAGRWLDRRRGPVRDRAEVGLHRDAAWRAVCAAIRSGAALAIDYAHLRTERESGRYDAGSITGYSNGATHWPIPDGSMNITAHVALDACAAATQPAGCVRSQSEWLDELLPETSIPSLHSPKPIPDRYAEQLQRHTQRARILNRSSGVYWLTVEFSEEDDTDVCHLDR